MRLGKVRTKRIFRKRDHGLILLTNKYTVSVRRAAFTKKKIDETGFALFTQIAAGATISKGLFSTLDEEKLDKLEGEATRVFKKTMDNGGKKLTDVTGKGLKLEQPNYDKQVKELVKNNLKYVKDLGNDQKDLMIKKISTGIKEGKTYAQMSEDITGSIKDMTKSRANLIARTELTKATGMAMEKTMEVNGFKTYFYLTAQDDRVSDICNINSFGNKEGRGSMQKHITGKGPIPVVNSHPRCRCSILKA